MLPRLRVISVRRRLKSRCKTTCHSPPDCRSEAEVDAVHMPLTACARCSTKLPATDAWKKKTERLLQMTTLIPSSPLYVKTSESVSVPMLPKNVSITMLPNGMVSIPVSPLLAHSKSLQTVWVATLYKPCRINAFQELPNCFDIKTSEQHDLPVMGSPNVCPCCFSWLQALNTRVCSTSTVSMKVSAEGRAHHQKLLKIRASGNAPAASACPQ